MPKALREKICKKIRDDITYGTFAPGARVIEAELAQKYKVSRSPIREVLRQLESEGLITLEINKGTTIAKPSIKQVDEISNNSAFKYYTNFRKSMCNFSSLPNLTPLKRLLN